MKTYLGRTELTSHFCRFAVVYVDSQKCKHLPILQSCVAIFCSCKSVLICHSPPIDSIMRLVTVWMITGKIIRTAIIDTYAQS